MKLKNLTHSQDKDSRSFANELSEILREYIGDKLNLEGKAITAAEVEAKLKASDFKVSQADSARILMEKFEAQHDEHLNELTNIHKQHENDLK